VPLKDPQRKIARTQLYFIDACRVLLDDIGKYEFPGIADIFEKELGGRDNRSGPIFYATVSNTQAYSKTGEQTLFSEALIECLNSEAVVPTNEQDASGYAKYRVSIYSLAETLNAKAEALQTNGLDQEFYSIPKGSNETIVNFPKPPEVECTLYIEPEPAAQHVSVNVRDARGAVISGWSVSPVDPHPYRGSLRVGLYTLQATITNPPHPPYIDESQQIISVVPQKDFEVKARMIT